MDTAVQGVPATWIMPMVSLNLQGRPCFRQKPLLQNCSCDSHGREQQARLTSLPLECASLLHEWKQRIVDLICLLPVLELVLNLWFEEAGDVAEEALWAVRVSQELCLRGFHPLLRWRHKTLRPKANTQPSTLEDEQLWHASASGMPPADHLPTHGRRRTGAWQTLCPGCLHH